MDFGKDYCFCYFYGNYFGKILNYTYALVLIIVGEFLISVNWILKCLKLISHAHISSSYIQYFGQNFLSFLIHLGLCFLQTVFYPSGVNLNTARNGRLPGRINSGISCFLSTKGNVWCKLSISFLYYGVFWIKVEVYSEGMLQIFSATLEGLSNICSFK